jgi:hypothetical protein
MNSRSDNINIYIHTRILENNLLRWLMSEPIVSDINKNLIDMWTLQYLINNYRINILITESVWNTSELVLKCAHKALVHLMLGQIITEFGLIYCSGLC